MKQLAKQSRFALLFPIFWLFLAPIFAQDYPVPFFDEQSKLYGFTNAKQTKVKIDPLYEGVSPFREGYAKVKKQGKYYLINKRGKLVTEFPFEQIGWSDDSTALSPPTFYGDLIGFQIDGRWGILDDKGRIVVEPFAHSLEEFRYSVSKASQHTEDGKLLYGLATPKGTWFVEPLYDSLEWAYQEKQIQVWKKGAGNRWLKGLLKSNGSVIIPPMYAAIEQKTSDLFAAQLPEPNGKWALYHTSGDLVYPPELQKIHPFKEGKALAMKAYKFGLISEKGEELVPFQYGDVQETAAGYQFSPLPHYTLLNLEGETINGFYFENMQCLGQGVYRFQANGKWGLIDSTGQTALYGKYADISLFVRGRAVVTDKNGRKGLINRAGETILPTEFSDISFDSSGLIRGTDLRQRVNFYAPNGTNLTVNQYQIGPYQNGFYTLKTANGAFFTDSTLSTVFPRNFEEVYPFQSGGYAVVQENGLQGIINQEGQWIIRPYIDRLQVVNQHYFIFEDNGEWGTVNANGIELFKTSPEVKRTLRADGLLLLERNGKVGLVNKWGSQILPIAYDSVSAIVGDRLVKVYQKGKMAYMDTEAYIPPQFNAFEGLEIIGPPSEGLFPVKFMGNCGFVDYRGRIRISNQYTDVKPFSEGLAPFKLGSKWGYMDVVEHFIIQPEFEEPGDFLNGLAIVTKEGKKGVIDPREKAWIPFQYDRIERTAYGNFKIWEGERVGIYDGHTWRMLAPLYKAVEDCGNGAAIILRKGKYGLNKTDGESLAYPEYDRIIFNKIDNSYFLIKHPEPLLYP